tara:strand:+ start:3902 stop:4933 length:1032 start_codon:yes stop_codon:yes gene_type:complete
MPDTSKRKLVIGDGSWGTSLALLLARNGHPTVMWSRNPERAELLNTSRTNEKYLPGIEFPDNLEISADPFAAAEGIAFAVSVVPTQHLREVARRFEDALKGKTPIVTASKGLEIETFRTPSQVLQRALGKRSICVLTGPSHAEEVARGLPASLVAGCADQDFAIEVQECFSSDTVRVYAHRDARGAELAAALKNVIALAAGICDGLKLGDNAKSALITRGVVEMARFGIAHGAEASTFFGLAGIGDLMTTCFSKHSRNRAVGEKIGQGHSLQEILGEMNMVAEGVWTTKALFGPEAELEGVDMPIAEQVHACLFEGKDPREASADLMTRSLGGEMTGILEGLA